MADIVPNTNTLDQINKRGVAVRQILSICGLGVLLQIHIDNRKFSL